MGPCERALSLSTVSYMILFVVTAHGIERGRCLGNRILPVDSSHWLDQIPLQTKHFCLVKRDFEVELQLTNDEL